MLVVICQLVLFFIYLHIEMAKMLTLDIFFPITILCIVV